MHKALYQNNSTVAQAAERIAELPQCHEGCEADAADAGLPGWTTSAARYRALMAAELSAVSVALVAGEASGDLLAQLLLRGLRGTRWSEATPPVSAGRS